MTCKQCLLLTAALLTATLQQAGAQTAADTFRELCRTEAQGSGIAVAGKDGWYFLKSELRFLGAGDFWGENAQRTSRSANPKTKDPLAAITAYQKALEAENIELLLVPIPPKAVIYPDMLPASTLKAARYDASLQRFYDVLRKEGVNVIDLTPTLMNARKNSTEPLYCKGDSHFSSYGCKVVAEAIAQVMKKNYGLEGTQSYAVEKNTATICGDLYKAAKGTAPKDETLTLYTVTGAGTKSKDSPVLMLGDSHTLVFDVGSDLFATGAGLPSLLAASAGMPVDVMGVRGSGATPARINTNRRSKSDKNFLKKKKLFIWCFSAREFTEASGWNANVPVK